MLHHSFPTQNFCSCLECLLSFNLSLQGSQGQVKSESCHFIVFRLPASCSFACTYVQEVVSKRLYCHGVRNKAE